MSTSRVIRSLPLMPKRKQPWPDPEASIGILCGTIKGKYSYWEARGPAQEAYEQIKAEIREILNCNCGPVRCPSVLNYDIYMVGQTPKTARPHIMFSCKHPEARKQAVAAVRKSGILNRCPPGIHLGHWSCPPHIVNFQLLAFYWRSQGNRTGGEMTKFNYCIRPIFDAQIPGSPLAMRLVKKSWAKDARIPLTSATIGSIMEIDDGKFYLVPQHFFSEFDAYQVGMSGNGEDAIDDNDCELGAFSDDDITVEGAEYMSQYSLSPPVSESRLNSDSESDGAFWDMEPEECCPFLEPRPAESAAVSKSDRKETKYSPALEIGSVEYPIRDPMFSSKDLDYALIEADQMENSTFDLPVLSRESVAKIKPGRVDVAAVTGSGHFLHGLLSGRPSYVRLPNATTFHEVFTVQFDGLLLPGDSGSVVRDSNTGMIYGHIFGGIVETRVAYIIPADAVLAHLEKNFKSTCRPRTTSKMLDIITTAIQSTKSLQDTVQLFKDRNKTLQRLQNELENLTKNLGLIKQAVHAGASVSVLLQGPIGRCGEVCREFEQEMKTFSRDSVTGLRDWGRMLFMGGDMNEFIDTITGYTSIILVGVGAVTIQASKVSYQALQEYDNLVGDTLYNLVVCLQRIDWRLAQLNIEMPNKPSAADIEMKEEKAATDHCLRICEDAMAYINSLAAGEPSIFQNMPPTDAEEPAQKRFEAQYLTRQALEDSQHSLAEIIGRLKERLNFLAVTEDPKSYKERLWLLEDLNIYKQCLEVCKVAGDMSNKEIYSAGNRITDSDSNHVVVATLGDLSNAWKLMPPRNSTRLLGSMGPRNLPCLVENRYNSRRRTMDSGSGSAIGSHTVCSQLCKSACASSP